MVLNWHLANKYQLLQIALNENCPIDYKFEAAVEIQMRQWRNEFLLDLVRLWGDGKTSSQIATELGIERNVVSWQLEKHDLYGRRVLR